MSTISLEHGGRTVVDGVDALVVAGWTGRDSAAVEHHVRELEALGVAPPSTVPLYYRVAASLLGHARAIEVVGGDTSGEAEPLLVRAADGALWLGVASDHTDRALESRSVALSKQICAKPCARGLWRFDDVAERLDALELRAWIAEDAALVDAPGDAAGWTLYQEGTLAAIRPLAELLDASPLGTLAGGAADRSSDRTDAVPNDASHPGRTGRDDRSGPDANARRGAAAMLCGTLPALGGVRPAAAFRAELADPANDARLELRYAVRALPEVS